jgi:hypothetical protein
LHVQLPEEAKHDSQLSRLPVPFGVVFPKGAYVLGVGPQRDFDRSTRERPVQQLDEHGVPIWVVEGIDGDPDGQGDKQFRVKIAARVQPVPPEALPGTPFRPVEFVGLTVTPWVDSARCTGPRKGEPHKCKARVSYSLMATGMRPPSVGVKPRHGSGDGDGKAA